MLAGALGEVLIERNGGLWFGWPGETRSGRLVAEGNVEFALADLSEAEHEGFALP